VRVGRRNLETESGTYKDSNSDERLHFRNNINDAGPADLVVAQTNARHDRDTQAIPATLAAVD